MSRIWHSTRNFNWKCFLVSPTQPRPKATSCIWSSKFPIQHCAPAARTSKLWQWIGPGSRKRETHFMRAIITLRLWSLQFTQNRIYLTKFNLKLTQLLRCSSLYCIILGSGFNKIQFEGLYIENKKKFPETNVKVSSSLENFAGRKKSWKLSIFQFLIHEKSIPKSGAIWRHNKTMNKFYCGKEAREARQ